MTAGQDARNTYRLALTAVCTALVCVVAPFSIPLPGDVPLSMANFVLLLATCLLGERLGFLCCVAYLLLGIAGVPVFAGFGAGLGMLIGPTGGYLVGYVPMVVLAGVFSGRVTGLVLGILADYVFGTVWLWHTSGVPLVAACIAGVVPFVPGDVIKIILLYLLVPKLRVRLGRIQP